MSDEAEHVGAAGLFTHRALCPEPATWRRWILRQTSGWSLLWDSGRPATDERFVSLIAGKTFFVASRDNLNGKSNFLNGCWFDFCDSFHYLEVKTCRDLHFSEDIFLEECSASPLDVSSQRETRVHTFSDKHRHSRWNSRLEIILMRASLQTVSRWGFTETRVKTEGSLNI